MSIAIYKLSMQYEYNDIVRRYYEELKPLFLNYLRKSFNLDFDTIMDIYANVWIDVRENLKRGKVLPGTKWHAYILQMGWRQANNIATRRRPSESFEDPEFSQKVNAKEIVEKLSEDPEARKSVYEDPDVQFVLAAELSYIPDPCNKILKMYYYDEMSMKEIAVTMNYSSANSVKTTKNRCLDKLKERVRRTVEHLGILN